MITPLGTQTVGVFAPGVASILAALVAEVQGKVDGALAAQLSIGLSPPTLAGQLDAALDAVASLTLAIAVGAPELNVQGAIVAELVIELQAQLALLLELNTALGVFGVTGFLFEGNASQLATELGGNTNGGVAGGAPGDSLTAIVLCASEPGVIAALSAIFGVP